MNKKNATEINSSSLLELKAELLRKQQQFKQQKTGGATSSRLEATGKSKKNDIWSKTNSGVRERAQKDYEAKKEEDDVLAKSRKMLETKAKAYEKMMTANKMGVADEEGNERFLVDFERKATDELIGRKHKREEEEDSISLGKPLPGQDITGKQSDEKHFGMSDELEEDIREEPVPESDHPEEQWVDYTDSLGRSRRCLRKDLPMMKDMDQDLFGKMGAASSDGGAEPGLPELMSSDMYRERLRDQWEKEQLEAMEQDDTHYSNVRFDEARDHGVGFYQFDKDAEKRTEQLDKLTALRQQTKQTREAQKKLKNKKKAMMAARLLKVKQRKLIREGKDPSEALEESIQSSDSDEDVIGPKLSEKASPEPLQRDDSWRHEAPVREWDKGKDDLEEFLTKRPVYTEATWKEKLRAERQQEFAPPSMYNDSDNLHVGKRMTNTQPSLTKKLKSTDPMAMLETKTATGQQYGSHIPNVPDVGAMLSGIRAEMDKTTEGSNVAEIPLPMGVNSDQLPPLGVNTYLPPPGVSTHLPPPGVSTHLPPPGVSTHLPPPGVSTHLPPPGVSTQLPPPGVSTHLPPPGFSTHLPPLGVSSHQPPPGVSTHLPPPGVSTHQPPPGVHTHLPPPGVSTHQPPPGFSTHLPPPGVSTHLPPPGVATHLPPPVVATHLPPPGVATHLLPPGVSSDTSIHAPQPAHYSSGPVRCTSQARAPQYQRVNLHELPLELPAPPTNTNVPEYPSQEEVFGKATTDGRKKVVTEEMSIKQWQRQFDHKHEGGSVKTDSIPFPAPYVQSEQNTSEQIDPAENFDPSKPPPNFDIANKLDDSKMQ